MGYRLRANERTAVPARHIALAADTVESPCDHSPGTSIHRLLRWCAISWRVRDGRVTAERSAEGDGPAAAWEWIESRLSASGPTWLWAHSLALRLGALQAWERFESGDLSFSAPPGPRRRGTRPDAPRKAKRGAIVTADPPAVLACYDRRGRKLVCVDVQNWVTKPLAWIALRVGLHCLARPGELGEDADWAAHCRRDCEVVAAFARRLMAWVKQSDLGNLRWTIAAQAMQTFRHTCDPGGIVVHDRFDVKARERLAYVGARTAVYWDGVVAAPTHASLGVIGGIPSDRPLRADGPIYRVDVTGAYPHVMRGRPYPVRYRRTEYAMRVEALRQWLRGGCAIADVRIFDRAREWPSMRTGPAAWRAGRVRSVLCGPELIAALDAGVVGGVEWAQLYDAGCPFDPFVSRYWEGRSASRAARDDLGEALWKGLANSLHGKFAQRRHRWALVPDAVPPVPWGVYYDRDRTTWERITCRAIGRAAQRELPAGETTMSAPAIAAYVTAYAREHVRQTRLVAGADDTLYEDADTLHVTEAGWRRLHTAGLVCAGVLGKWHLVQIASVAIYHGPRDYQLDDVVVCGGLATSAEPSGEGVWCQTEFARLDGQLCCSAAPVPVSYDRRLKRPQHPIDGRVLPSGRVVPLEAEDW